MKTKKITTIAKGFSVSLDMTGRKPWVADTKGNLTLKVRVNGTQEEITIQGYTIDGNMTLSVKRNDTVVADLKVDYNKENAPMECID